MASKTILHVSSILWNSEQEAAFVILNDAEGHGYALPVNYHDASKLIIGLRGDWGPQISAEVTIANLLKQFKARPIEVHIYAASQNEVFIHLVYSHGFAQSTLDMSPTDAFSFALRYTLPITIPSNLWKALCLSKSPSYQDSSKTSKFYLITPPKPDLPKHPVYSVG